METLKNAVVRFVQDEEGAGVIEYSLIAGIMASIIILVIYKGGLKQGLVNVFSMITSSLNTAAG